jgi:drug/metabolite transporter (DMT)-like permease
VNAPLAIGFALLGAFSQGLTSLLQRVANLESPAGPQSLGAKITFLLHRPMWLLGWVAMGGTFVFTALALYFGTLATVQPILVTELIFTLALRALWLHDPIQRRVWIAATVMCAGLFGFLLVAQPQEGHGSPTARDWLIALSTRGLIIIGLYVLSRWGSPARRAALLGACAALMWAIDAAFVKTATEQLAQVGVLRLFLHWPIYAVIITGVLGTIFLEAAFSAGPLTASQPAVLIIDPLASIMLGIEIFGETLNHSPLAITFQVFFLAVMCGGVWFLSQWAPPEKDGRRPAPLNAPA